MAEEGVTTPPPSVVCPKFNPEFKAISERRQEERAARFAEDHVLSRKLVPMLSKAAWML